MPKRFVMILLLSSLPMAAGAGSLPQGSEPSAGLGPSTSGVGSSTADSGALQPAGTSPIQSTTDDSTGLTAPSNVLQGSVPSNEQLQVLAGDGDGHRHEPAEPSSDPFVWLLGLIPLALIIGLLVLLRDRKRFASDL